MEIQAVERVNRGRHSLLREYFKKACTLPKGQAIKITLDEVGMSTDGTLRNSVCYYNQKYGERVSVGVCSDRIHYQLYRRG